MAPEKVVDPAIFTSDVVEFISCLYSNGVRFMIVGGEAVIYYGHIRFTGDVDFFYDIDPVNINRLYLALQDFWSNEIPTLEGPEDLGIPGGIYQFGMPLNRIDLLNEIDGVSFQSAWPSRTRVLLGTHPDKVPFAFISLDDLLSNKRASARPKDLSDLAFLEGALKNQSK